MSRRTREQMEDDLKDRCCWKRCREASDLVYFDVGLCQHHWERWCELEGPLAHLNLLPEVAQVMHRAELQAFSDACAAQPVIDYTRKEDE